MESVIGYFNGFHPRTEIAQGDGRARAKLH